MCILFYGKNPKSTFWSTQCNNLLILAHVSHNQNMNISRQSIQNQNSSPYVSVILCAFVHVMEHSTLIPGGLWTLISYGGHLLLSIDNSTLIVITAYYAAFDKIMQSLFVKYAPYLAEIVSPSLRKALVPSLQCTFYPGLYLLSSIPSYPGLTANLSSTSRTIG